MTFTRTNSMPEANALLAHRFPMNVRKINDLSPVRENEKVGKETMIDEKPSSSKGAYKLSNADGNGTEETVEDDYGFFPMDDEDFQNGETQHSTYDDDAASSSNSVGSSDQFGSSYDSAPGRRRKGMKSSLKRGSAYGDGNDSIPLDFERKEFNRVLPKPDLSQRASSKGMKKSGSKGLFRVASEPVFVRPVYQVDDLEVEDEVSTSERSSSFVEGAMKKRISFGTIQIREHVQTIGDNPSCSYGTPVQLDWGHEDMEALDVDEYEAYRPRTRKKQEFQLNHFQRTNLLKSNGYSTNEIKDSKKAVDKVRRQREMTKFVMLNYPQMVMVNDAMESGLRKIKRSVSKSKLDADKKGESLPRKASKDDLAVLQPSGLTKELLLEMMDNDDSNATAPF